MHVKSNNCNVPVVKHSIRLHLRTHTYFITLSANEKQTKTTKNLLMAKKVFLLGVTGGVLL
jgi:hypothetical protein